MLLSRFNRALPVNTNLRDNLASIWGPVCSIEQGTSCRTSYTALLVGTGSHIPYCTTQPEDAGEGGKEWDVKSKQIQEQYPQP